MKRRLKVLLAVAFAAALAVPAVALAATGFADVDEADWFAADVEWAASEGLMTGSGDGTFEPNAGEARAMLISTLHRVEGEPAATNADSRVPEGAWYEGPANWALEEGLLVGYDNGDLGLLDELTREQLAVFMHRYAEWKGYDVSAGADADVLSSYDDASDVSEWATPAMQWAVAEGLITGYTDADGELTGVLDPKGTCTRAMTAAILHRFFDNVAPEPEPAPTPTPVYPSHTHDYGNWVSKGDGTHTGTCEGNDSTKTEDCTTTFVTNNNGTHTLSCQKCDYSVTETCTYGASETNAFVYACACGHTFTLTNGEGDEAVTNPKASVGNTGYETLEAALEAAAAADGDKTVVLLVNVETTAQLNVPEGVTLNGNGKTITVSQSLGTDNGSKHAMLLASGSRVDNLTVDSNEKAYGIQAFDAEGVTLNDVTTMNSLGAGLLVNDSSVTAANLSASGNAWGSVNVDKGSPSFTLNGGSLEDIFQIYSEIESTEIVDADGYNSIYDIAYGGLKFRVWNDSDLEAALEALEDQSITVPVELTILSDQRANDLVVPENVTLIVGADVELALAGETEGLILDADRAELIYSATQLEAFAAKVNGGTSYDGRTVKLMADIDLGNEPWTSIGDCESGKYFQGTFDGQNHAISNLSIDYSTDESEHATAGLFGWVDAAMATVKNLKVDGATVKGSHWVGVIAGYFTGRIENCSVNDATVVALNLNDDANGDKVGGIVGCLNEHGYLNGNTVSNSTISGNRDIGGIAGSVAASTYEMKNNKVENVGVSYTAAREYASAGEIVSGRTGYVADESNAAVNVIITQLASNSEELSSAVAYGNDATVVLSAGSYTIPTNLRAGQKVTFVGNGEETAFDFTRAYNVNGASITFENLKIQGKNENMMSGFGIQHTTGDIVYKNCTLVDAVTSEHNGTVTYDGCKFTGTYYIATYSVRSAAFEDCIFDRTDSRAILVYSHGNNPVEVTVDGCTFKAAEQGKTGAGDWTAAVEVDTTHIRTTGTSVSISDCTYDANYSGIVRDKSPANATKAAITVDGRPFAN